MAPMRYIVMITKLQIKYALIKINMILQKRLRHNLQQLLNYLSGIPRGSQRQT